MALQVFYLFLIALILSSGRLGVFGDEDEGDEQADAAYSQPSFTSIAGEHTALAGSTATLPCRVTDLSGGTYDK